MYLGIDIGSTTIKTVLCDRNGDILYSDYRRHNTDITATAAAGTAPEEAHGTQDDVETGLRCANNDICYPATIVVGSIINFLKSGKLPRAEGTHRTGSGGIRRSHPHRTASPYHRNRRRDLRQIQFVQQQGRGPLAQPPWHRDGSPLRLQLLHLRLCQPPHQ